MSLIYNALGTGEYLDDDIVSKIHKIESEALTHTLGKIKQDKRFLVKFSGFLLTVRYDLKNRSEFSPVKLKEA